MKRWTTSRIVRCGVFLAAALAAPTATAAHPLPQHVISRGAVSTSRIRYIPGAHDVFGTIVALRPAAFTLRTRRGRLLRVDDSAVLKSGLYSAPLFVGKAVLVIGIYDTAGGFHTTNVQRMTRIGSDTPPDR
jgi:hypothetical protein